MNFVEYELTGSKLNLSLEDVAKTNIDKLFSRKDRNKIHGDEDNR